MVAEKKTKTPSNIEKYSMSIYHFNLQYKAGDKDSYFSLVKASFTPFVKFFDEHPEWKASLELQGHFVGFLARHFPEDLKLLQKLNQRGQIEIVNVHYSDQVYLAYPYRDMQESCKNNTEIFKRYGLKRSGVFFAQENFFGEGAEKYMRENGYNIALMNQHFYSHHHEERPVAPFYKYKSLDVLVKGSHGYTAEDGSLQIEQRFSYWDDGELAFASGNNYMPGYGASEKAYQAHTMKYKGLEREGFKMVTVTEYIERMKELQLEPTELGPITDGSWNMFFYGGVYLWMGTYRLPWERDGEIRSFTYRVRNKLLATEKLIEYCAGKGVPISDDVKINLRMAWKHLLLAEVSDSTGQTPVLIEVYYTPKEAQDCVIYCNKIYGELSRSAEEKGIQFPWQKYIDTDSTNIDSMIIDERPKFYGIDKKAGYELKSKDYEYVPYSVLKEFVGGNVNLLRVRKRSVKFATYKAPLPSEIENGEHLILDLKWHPNYTRFVARIMMFFRKKQDKKFTPLFDRKFGNYAGLMFPLNGDELRYCPALMEDEPKIYKLSEFDFGRTWIGLPNGMIGLGNDTYVIKHNYYGDTHIAATVSKDDQFPGGANKVSFMTLNPPRKTYNWRFSLFKGSLEDAVKLANRINVNPIVKLELRKKFV